jgi:hypothetical protein
VARYHGRKAAIYLATTGTGNASQLSAATAWTLDGATEKIDVTAFRDPNMVRVQGIPDRSGTFSAFWDDTDGKLFTGAESDDGVKLYLYMDVENKPTAYFYGPAWVDFSINVGVKDAVQVSGNWVANGAWGSNGL